MNAKSDKCPICNQWLYPWRKHRCPPAWLVWDALDGPEQSTQDARTFYAIDAGSAAEKYVEFISMYNGECCEGDTEVLVSPAPNPDEKTLYIVHGELTLIYSATPAERHSR